MIFDSHAHYDSQNFDGDRSSLLAAMQEHGIGWIMNVGATMEGSKQSAALAEQYPFVYAAVGVHPSEIEGITEADMETLCSLCTHEKVRAVGEIGLDYYWDTDHALQKKWFVRQLDLAKETGLPIIIHSRDAAKDTLDIMKAERADTLNGVLHCFSYTKEMAREYMNMGYFLGIGGVVTFKNAKKLKEVVEYAPLDYLLLETDAPYLTPEPYRKKRNTSLYLPYVVQEIARIKGISYEEVVEKTAENAKQLFQI